MKCKNADATYEAPIIWLLGLQNNEKEATRQVLNVFENMGIKFCTVDFSKKRINGNLTIDFQTINMSRKEGKPYYDHVYEQLCEMGYCVE